MTIWRWRCIVAVACITGATLLAVLDKEGWGWLILLAFVVLA